MEIDLSQWSRVESGTLSEVYTNGQSIARRMGPHSVAIHQLLKHFEQRGITRVPRLLSTAGSFEVLSLLPGAPIARPWPAAALSLELIRDVGALVRKLHESTRDFRLSEDVAFVGGNTNSHGSVVVHGDVGPWNTLLHNGQLSGIIDWDMACFGDPITDVVGIAVEFGPLRKIPGHGSESHLKQDLVLRRIEALCKGYGNLEPGSVVKMAPALLREKAAQIRLRALQGIRQFEILVERHTDLELEQDANEISLHYGPQTRFQ